MDEKKEEAKPETEEKTEDETDATLPEEGGDKGKTTSILDRADEINDRKERILKREEALQDRKDAFAARKAVGGETEAGQPAEKSESQKKEANAQEFFKGTALGDAITKVNE